MALFLSKNPTASDFTQPRWLPSLRSVLLTTVGAIMVMSLLMVASASMPFAQTKHLAPLYFFYHQLAYMVLGMLMGWIFTKIPLRYLFNINWIIFMMVMCILAILYTVLFGSSINGSKRWIEIAGFNFQPVEMAKLVMIVFTADYLIRRSDDVRNGWSGFVRLLVITGFLTLFIIMQPDFGSIVIIAGCMAAMVFVGGLPKSQFLIIMGVMAAMAVVGVFSARYRLERVMSFMNPFDDLQDTDFQLGRSLVAFGRGEWTGVGYGESIQKLSHLPEAHTDFLLAITGEELGFFGVTLLIILQAILLATIMKISFNALKRHQNRISYLAFGVAVLFFGQILVNGGMNMGMLPTKGLTMPFFSYGGSSMVVNLIIVGILLRILHEAPNIAPQDSRRY